MENMAFFIGLFWLVNKIRKFAILLAKHFLKISKWPIGIFIIAIFEIYDITNLSIDALLLLRKQVVIGSKNIKARRELWYSASKMAPNNLISHYSCSVSSPIECLLNLIICF